MPEPTLDYFRPPARPSFTARLIERVNFPADPVLQKWWTGRVVYYAFLCAVFSAMAFYFGPNRILHGKWTALGPEDFVQWVHGDRPVIVAVKEFQRDNGRLPRNGDELVPEYLPTPPDIRRDGKVQFYAGDHYLFYDLTAGREGWIVEGPDVNGRIPAPVVELGAANADPSR